MRNRFGHRAGFTLVELLLVIAIIAVLLAMLLPLLSSAKVRAHTTCLNNLKQLDVGVHLYAEEHAGVLPALALSNNNNPPMGSAHLKLIRRYVGLNGPPSPQDSLLTCPADRFHYDSDDFFPGNLGPRIPQGHHQQSAYGFTSYLFNAGNVNTNFPGVAGMTLSAIKEPVKTVLMSEASALWPYSWHRPVRASHFDNALNVLAFADGHAAYTRIHWDQNRSIGHFQAWHYDPPPSYDYKWSGN